MSAKITDTFPVLKKKESVAKKYPQKKVKKEVKAKDDKPKVYPNVKDVEDLKVLRDFDLRCEYGPCIGISRLERWSRAQEYDLDPPAEVKQILEKHANNSKFTHCIWNDEKLL